MTTRHLGRWLRCNLLHLRAGSQKSKETVFLGLFSIGLVLRELGFCIIMWICRLRLWAQ